MALCNNCADERARSAELQGALDEARCHACKGAGDDGCYETGPCPVCGGSGCSREINEAFAKTRGYAVRDAVAAVEKRLGDELRLAVDRSNALRLSMDAVRVEGVRLGIKAAANAAQSMSEHGAGQQIAARIRALDAERIATEER